MTGVLRRTLSGITAVLGVAASALALPAPASAAVSAATPIDHVVFMLQSNHSFDNYFGARPGVDGLPKDACQPSGKASVPCVRPFPITDGTDTSVLLDSADVFRTQYASGRMDGFVKAYAGTGANANAAMGYYTRAGVPYYHDLADRYVLFDRYFASAPSGGVANRMFAVAAQPGKASPRGAVPKTGWGDTPTIFDRLQAKGVSWKFYVQNYDAEVTFRTSRAANPDRAAQVVRVPLLGYARYVDDKRLASHIVDMNQYYVDLANGTLPAVSYIATSGDNEHPPASIDAGQRTVSALITALQRSSSWSSSAFMLGWDDWGGWYDHVPPVSLDGKQSGFRVPGLLVSPYARTGYVDHTVVDHTSVLKFMEDNWRLAPLTTRDKTANSIASAFNFSQAPRPAELAGAGKTNLAAGIHRWRIYGAYGMAVVAVVALASVVAIRERRRSGAADHNVVSIERELV